MTHTTSGPPVIREDSFVEYHSRSGIVWAFVMTAVYRTDSDAYRIRSCNTLFLLYLDVEEPSENKKKRKKNKARETTEGTL